MLAAVSGLAYTMATLVKLESYLGYFLPMPVIVAAMRSGPASGRKTMTATCFLLLLLLGPLRALDYFFSHGLLAVVLGSIWHLKSHWSISLAVGAVTRLVGLLGYFYITAWILKEDLLSLMLSNVYALLDRIAGGAGSPPLAVVIGVIAVLLAIHAVLYVALLHVVYLPMLQSMGYQTSKLPKFAQRVVAARTGQFAQ